MQGEQERVAGAVEKKSREEFAWGWRQKEKVILFAFWRL